MNRALVALAGLSFVLLGLGLGCGELGRREQPRHGPKPAPEAPVSAPKRVGEPGPPEPAAAPDPEADAKILRQTRERLLAAAELAPGMVVAEIGASRGWFVDRAALAVGPGGRVYATDIDPEAIAALRELVASDHPARAPVEVRPCAGERDTGLSALGEGAVDRMLMIDSLCFDGRFSRAANVAYLGELRRVLRPGAQLLHHMDCACELPLGEVAELFEAAGFEVELETLDLQVSEATVRRWSCRSPARQRRHGRLLRATRPE